MGHRRRMGRMVVGALFAGTLLLGLSGCAVMDNLLSWLQYGNTDDRGRAFSNTETAANLSQIRPFEDPTHYYKKACYLQERKKHRLAVQEFLSVIRIDPNHVDAYNGLGVSYDCMGDFPKAVAAYKKGLTIDPDSDYILNNLGYSYLLQGDLEAAVAAFRKAVSLHPASKRYRNNLGLAYARMGLSEPALAEFKKTGEEAVAHGNLAKILYEKGASQEAGEHFSQALALDAGTKAGSTQETSRESAALGRSAPRPEPKVSPTFVVDERNFCIPGRIVTAPIVYPEEVREERAEWVEVSEVDQVLRESETVAVEDLPQPLFLGSVTPPDIEIIPVSIKEDPDAEILSNKNETGVDAIDAQAPGVSPAAPVISDTLTPPESAEVVISMNTGREADRSGDGEGVVSIPSDPVPDAAPARIHAPEKITVEIRSFKGIHPLVKRIGEDLAGKGFNVEYLDNAVSDKNRETRVHWRPAHLQDAYEVAKVVPRYQNMDKVTDFSRPDIRVRIVFGRDLLPYAVALAKGQDKGPRS